MSYEPTNWQEGDLITSERLNKMEQGIASGEGGIFLIPAEYDSSTGNATMQKTAGEIFEAASSGKLCVMEVHSQDNGVLTINQPVLTGVSKNGSMYMININDVTFYANSPTEYPSTSTAPSGGDDSGGGDSGSGDSGK